MLSVLYTTNLDYSNIAVVLFSFPPLNILAPMVVVGGGELSRSWGSCVLTIGREGCVVMGFGELQIKNAHRLRSMPAMKASPDIVALILGVVVEPLHLLRLPVRRLSG